MLLVATVACGAWSVYTFVHLSVAVGDTLHESEQTLDLTATLASHLEREDDALLLSLAARSASTERDLSEQRRRFDDTYARLLPLLTEPDERAVAAALREHVDAYRAAGDALVRREDPGTALGRYHQSVNPILRHAVADCGAIREHDFRSMKLAGVRAHDEAQRASKVVAAVLVVALIVSALAALYLARSVLRPVLALTESVDALRQGDFERRVRVTTQDELGHLAEEFNRMADALADFRRSNLGEVLRAKTILEATLEALPDAIIVLDPDERIESTNPPARRVLFGDRPAPARLSELSLPDDALLAVRRALAGEHAESSSRPADLTRAFAVTLGGSERKFLPIAVPIANFAPGRSGAIAVLYDVTDFARLDELRGEVVAVASHELKTPLTTMRMNLMLLSERIDALEPRQREMVETALLGCGELETIIQRLLDLARIEAGQLRLTRERVDVRTLIEQTAHRFRDRSAEVGVRLDLELAPSPAIANVDAERLSIVLSNLLTNALKYTPYGGSVTVTLASMQNAGSAGAGSLQITVTDTGPGIPAELRERVFDKFFRVEHEHPNWSRGVRGAGLGLYLCRQILEAHGGAIHATAGDRGGLRIVMTLPVDEPPAREERPPTARPRSRLDAARS